MAEAELIPIKIAIVTISDTRTPATDKSGQTIADMVSEAGHEVVSRDIVTDNRELVRALFEKHIADPGVEVVIATGGTGITPRDVTPEALAPLVTKALPGFGELMRWLSYEEIGTSAIHSRAVGGLCGDTFIFAIPGSTGACRTAVGRILLEQFDSRHRPCNFVTMLPRILSEEEDPH